MSSGYDLYPQSVSEGLKHTGKSELISRDMVSAVKISDKSVHTCC